MNPSYHSISGSNRDVFSQSSSEVSIPRMTSRVVSDIIIDHNSDVKLSNDSVSLYATGHENDEHQGRGQRVQRKESIVITPPRLPHNRIMQFYDLLRSFDEAFCDFTFLLPGLKASNVSFDSVDESMKRNFEMKVSFFFDLRMMYGRLCNLFSCYLLQRDRTSASSQSFYSLNPQDLNLAKRRLKCARCALGGSVGDSPKLLSESIVSSIFRIENEKETRKEKTEIRLKYEAELPLRYYENQNRMSWDVEALPPIQINLNGAEMASDSEIDGPNRKEKNTLSTDNEDNESKESKVVNLNSSTKVSKQKRDFSATSSVPKKKSTPKMKYRCKLCGQPKQNHTCPYQQSLQRSIGTMSHPALNSYHRDEQGILSPSLTEMNSFAANDEDSQKVATSSRAGLDTRTTELIENDSLMAETERGMEFLKRRSSSLTLPSRQLSKSNSNQGWCNDNEMEVIASMNNKRRRKEIRGSMLELEGIGDNAEDALLLEEKVINSLQYRTVTPQQSSQELQYDYPTIPLTFGQRQSMSEGLFNLCEEIPGLTDECAVTLLEARKTNAWDLAIAELMTQVLVIFHCPFGDFRLNGLRRYLLTMGFSC